MIIQLVEGHGTGVPVWAVVVGAFALVGLIWVSWKARR